MLRSKCRACCMPKRRKEERKKERKREEEEKESLEPLGEHFLASGCAYCLTYRMATANYTLKFKEYEVQANKMKFCTFTVLITF